MKYATNKEVQKVVEDLTSRIKDLEIKIKDLETKNLLLDVKLSKKEK